MYLNETLSARRSGDEEARTGLAMDASEFGRIGTTVDELFDELDQRAELQRRAEEQRDLYAREVQHRVKNLLAIIQVIARQTLARPDVSPEVQAFEGRINAIIATNAHLLKQDDHSAVLEDLVRDAISPFIGGNSELVTAQGPTIGLRPKAASALGMALHELATNAVKYGALSTPEGRISVDWRAGDTTFEMDWVEQGGPPAVEPEQTGFGTVLICRVLQAETGGTVSMEFGDHGFAFHLIAPLENLGAQIDEPASPQA